MNETFYKGLIQNSPFGYARYCLVRNENHKAIDYRFVEINSAFEKITGLTLDLVEGKHVSEVIPAIFNDHFDYLNLYQRVCDTKVESENDQYSEALKKWFRVKTICTGEDEFVTHFSDITAQKENEGIIDGIVSLFDDVVFELDEQYNFLVVRTSREENLFLPKDQIVGKNLREFFGQEYAENLIEVFEKARETGDKQKFEYQSPMPGDNRIFRASVLGRIGEDNKYKTLISTRDISNRKNAENALKYHREFEELLVSCTTAMIQSNENSFDDVLNSVISQIGKFSNADRSYLFIFSDDGIRMSNTHEWCNVGVSAEKENLQEIPCEILPMWMSTLSKGQEVYITDVQGLTEEWAGEKAILEPQGVKSLLALPVRAGDQLYGFIGFDAVQEHVLWDNTARHLLQIMADNLGSVIKRYEQNLSLQIASVNARQLAQEALAASIAKSDFLANMSHEVRTPLNGVVGFTELMMDTQLSDVQKLYTQNVLTSAHSLMELINQILDFSKIEAGKIELDIERSDLIDIVEKTCALVRHSSNSKDLHFILKISPDIPRFVHVDAVRLRQILVNLLSNAIKFTHEGIVCLSVEMTGYAAAEGKANFNFEVSDTGVGIGKNQVSKLFKAFSQADISTSKKYGGTGLGLVISQNLLAMMDSEIHLESKEGEGSKFSFDLKLKCEQAPAFEPLPIHRVGSVLVVTDNLDVFEQISSSLQYRNVHVRMVRDFQAVQTAILSPGAFDAIIIDDDLSVVNGRQLLRKLKQFSEASLHSLTVCMVYSDESREFHADCDELQVDSEHRLAKPILLSEIYKMLEYRVSKIGPALQGVEFMHSNLDGKSNNPVIMVAEDNGVNLLLTKILLNRIYPGAKIIEARNGRQAVDIAGAQKVDLILMDIQMPEMDGYEATRIIRASHAGRDIPIIALTANAVHGEMERCLAIGANGYLTKPLSQTDLYEMVVRTVG
jgi:signal transduction histidine kinase/CheY-like chemotaxis protein/PAS domain-containing protein